MEISQQEYLEFCKLKSEAAMNSKLFEAYEARIDEVISERDKLLEGNKRLRTALEKIKDNCQCETDDRDVCFYIATKALIIGEKDEKVGK